MQIQEYIPLFIGVSVIGGLIVWVEMTLRREGLSHVRARQSIVDRRVLGLVASQKRLEKLIEEVHRLAVRGLGSVGGTTTATGTVGTTGGWVGAEVAPLERIPVKCLDCGLVDTGTSPAHTEDCALRMDGLTESPEDAARRRSQD